MDIEFAEWGFIREACTASANGGELDTVDQFIVEVHIDNWHSAPVIREKMFLLHALEKAGFTLFDVRQNEVGLNLRTVDYSKPFTGQEEKAAILYLLSFLRLPK